MLLLAAMLCFGLGVYGGPPQSGNSGLPLELREAGAALYVVGAAMLSIAFHIVRDHHHKRPRQPATDEKNQPT